MRGGVEASGLPYAPCPFPAHQPVRSLYFSLICEIVKLLVGLREVLGIQPSKRRGPEVCLFK